MAHTELPDSDDIVALLGSMSPAIVLGGGFDILSEIDSAVESWNERTHYRPFFQTVGTDQTRAFDPPGPNRAGWSRGGSSQLELGNGLISCTSVLSGVNIPNGENGSLLILGQDYFLWPPNAQADPARLKPYTAIDFAVSRSGVPQSLVVTGVWGYCSGTIPDDAWKAIRDMAAAACLVTLVAAIGADGATTWRDIDQAETYDPSILASVGRMLSLRSEKALYRYRLMSF